VAEGGGEAAEVGRARPADGTVQVAAGGTARAAIRAGTEDAGAGVGEAAAEDVGGDAAVIHAAYPERSILENGKSQEALARGRQVGSLAMTGQYAVLGVRHRAQLTGD